jgi:NADPH:quinone reductase-like Zn-dependent oxidoreductase
MQVLSQRFAKTSSYLGERALSTDLAALFDLVAQGKIELVIAKRVGLNETTPAHEVVEQAVVKSKIRLIVNE